MRSLCCTLRDPCEKSTVQLASLGLARESLSVHVVTAEVQRLICTYSVRMRSTACCPRRSCRKRSATAQDGFNHTSFKTAGLRPCGVYYEGFVTDLDRVANEKNQPPNSKQLTPCAWRAHWWLNNRTQKLYSQVYIASELRRNCFMWLRG